MIYATEAEGRLAAVRLSLADNFHLVRARRFSGNVLREGVRYLNIGGSDITQRLKDLMLTETSKYVFEGKFFIVWTKFTSAIEFVIYLTICTPK